MIDPLQMVIRLVVAAALDAVIGVGLFFAALQLEQLKSVSFDDGSSIQ